MGYNRSGKRRTDKQKRRKRHEGRLLRKAEGQERREPAATTRR